MSFPKFLITTETSNLLAQLPAAGFITAIIPASLGDSLNSSAPISGLVEFLVSPSKSVANPDIGWPLPFKR